MRSEPDWTVPIDPEDLPIPGEATEAVWNRLSAELSEQRDLNRRLATDLEALRKRAVQEGDSRAVAWREDFIRQLLPAVDNLERALAVAVTGSFRPLHEGVRMTLEQLWTLLRGHGIEPEASVGQAFDPRRHEAVSQAHDPEQADQVVLEVLQRGYRQGVRVFRPARVVVNNWAPSGPPRNAC
jgi:molecular chaperone GrpE